MTLAYTISAGGEIVIIARSKQFVVNKSHTNYDKIIEALEAEASEEDVSELCDVSKKVYNFCEGNVEVTGGQVFYKGEAVHGTLVDRILQLCNQNLPYKPLIRFLDNLMQNPSSRAVNELYDFLENKGLPTTVDGCFLA